MSDPGVSQPQPLAFGASRPVLRAGGMPVWRQLRADIARQIEDGALSPGDALPSEAALAAAYGVSRLTIRRALADLVAPGPSGPSTASAASWHPRSCVTASTTGR